MNIEAGRSARAGRAVEQRGIGVGHIDHAGEVAAEQRFQRLAHFGKALRQLALQGRAGIVERAHDAAAPEQRALGRAVDDDVGDEAGEVDVVGADRQQDEVELARRLPAFRRGKRIAQFGELRIDGAGARHRVAGEQALSRFLRAEQAIIDGGAGAGQRQVGDGDMRILRGQRQRRAGLIAVERAMACRIEPLRAQRLPGTQADARGVAALAGARTLEVGAAGSVILAGRSAEIGLEAEAVVGQRHRLVRIAFAGRDGVAETGDEDIPDLDLGGDPLRVRSAGNVDGG